MAVFTVHLCKKTCFRVEPLVHPLITSNEQILCIYATYAYMQSIFHVDFFLNFLSFFILFSKNKNICVKYVKSYFESFLKIFGFYAFGRTKWLPKWSNMAISKKIKWSIKVKNKFTCQTHLCWETL